MKKAVYIFCYAVSVLFMSVSMNEAGAQESAGPDTLPQDPRVFKGIMPNGLTYYVAKDEQADSLASFYLVQKTGYMVEDTSETGFSYMIADLAMKGTRNFPRNTMSSCLKNFGVRTANSSNVKVYPDRTVFSIEDMLVSDPSAVDSALIMLYDWSCFINIDNSDIFSDTGKVERLRYSLLKHKLDKAAYISSPECGSYSDKGSISVDTRSLREFYYRWYRPDMQAVVVVGNLDSATVETKIRSMFSSIPKSRFSDVPAFFADSLPDGPYAEIICDESVRVSEMTLSFMAQPLPAPDKETAMSYLYEFCKDVFLDLTEKRIEEQASLSFVPIYDVSVSSSLIAGNPDKVLVNVNASVDPEQVEACVAMVAEELGRIVRYGMTENEYGLASGAYMNILRSRYDDRKKPGGFRFKDMFVSNFMYGRNLSSIELEYTMMQEMVPGFDIGMFNGFAESFIDMDRCRIALMLTPAVDRSGYDERNIVAAYDSGRYADTYSYLDRMISAPVADIPESDGSRIISASADSVSGAKVWKLSNGATVVYSRNGLSDGRMFMKAFRKGGLSGWKGNPAGFKVLDCTSDIGGLSNLDRLNLMRFMESEGIALSSNIYPGETILEGSVPLANMEDFFRLVYLSFRARRVDDDMFYMTLGRLAGELKYGNLSEENILRDRMRSLMFNDSPLVAPLSEEDMEMINYQMVTDFVRNEFSNPGDFVFLISANEKENVMSALVSDYIGAISPVPQLKTSSECNLPVSDTSRMSFAGSDTVYGHYEMNMYMKTSASPEDVVYADLLAMVLEDYLPGGEVEHSVIALPETYLMYKFRAVVGDKVGRYSHIVDSRLSRIVRRGISQKYLDTLKKSLRIKYRRESEKPDYMIDVMYGIFRNGSDIRQKQEFLENVTPDGLEDFIRHFIGSGTRITVTV